MPACFPTTVSGQWDITNFVKKIFYTKRIFQNIKCIQWATIIPPTCVLHHYFRRIKREKYLGTKNNKERLSICWMIIIQQQKQQNCYLMRKQTHTKTSPCSKNVHQILRRKTHNNQHTLTIFFGHQESAGNHHTIFLCMLPIQVIANQEIKLLFR